MVSNCRNCGRETDADLKSDEFVVCPRCLVKMINIEERERFEPIVDKVIIDKARFPKWIDIPIDERLNIIEVRCILGID